MACGRLLGTQMNFVRFLTTCENCSFVRKIVFPTVGCVYDILTFTTRHGEL